MTNSYKSITKIPDYYTDKDWVRGIFEIDAEEYKAAPWELRTWNTSELKFNDTAIGGSLVINPLPQPNVFTDPVSSTHFLKKVGANDTALSPYYSEAFDDNYRVVTFRMGTMAFTSLFGFLLNMYSPGAASLANKGLINTALFYLGRVIGAAVSLITWPITGFLFILKGMNFLMRKPSSRFAYLKPNMPLYWSRVQTIVNHFLVDLGLVFRRAPIYDDIDSQKDFKPDENQIEYMKRMWPNIYGANGFLKEGIMQYFDMQGQLDVFAVATRAQRLAIARMDALENINDAVGGVLDVDEIIKRSYRERRGRVGMTISQYLVGWITEGGSMYSSNKREEQDSIGDNPKANNIQDDKFLQFLRAEWMDGGAFISFRVDDTGAVSETFTNSYRQSSIQEKINSTSASMRSTMFNLAGGSLADNVLADGLEAIMGGLKSIVEGTIEQLGFGGILIAGGGGVVSMPKYWESSEAQMPKAQYQFTLRARYANNMVRFNDIYFPLSCFLAIALPQSAGKHSHTNPMYLEFYDKGRMQTRLGAIDSFTITRGDGNMGFTSDGDMMSLTVSFSILPMEEILAVPFSESFNPSDTFINLLGGSVAGGVGGVLAGSVKDIATSLTKGIFDDDNPWMDYMATLAGLGINEQHYLLSKLKRRLAFNKVQYSSKFSSAKFAATVSNWLPVQALAIISSSKYRNAIWYDEAANLR